MSELNLVRAMVRSLRSSSDVEALLRVEELTSAAAMEPLLERMRRTEEGRRVLDERPAMNSRTVDVDRLRALPEGTLGREYMAHLERNGLDLDALTVPVQAGPTEECNWLLERVRQTHDLWHTVLGCSTEPYQEVLVHAFQWSQLRMPYSALVVAFGIPKHFIGEARWRALRRQIPMMVRAGREADFMLGVYWEQHWEESMVSIRTRLRVVVAR